MEKDTQRSLQGRKRISEAKWSFDISQNFLKMILLINTISKQQRNLKKICVMIVREQMEKFMQ